MAVERTTRDDVERAMPAVLAALAEAADAALDDRFLRGVWADLLAEVGPTMACAPPCGAGRRRRRGRWCC